MRRVRCLHGRPHLVNQPSRGTLPFQPVPARPPAPPPATGCAERAARTATGLAFLPVESTTTSSVRPTKRGRGSNGWCAKRSRPRQSRVAGMALKKEGGVQMQQRKLSISRRGGFSRRRRGSYVCCTEGCLYVGCVVVWSYVAFWRVKCPAPRAAGAGGGAGA